MWCPTGVGPVERRIRLGAMGKSALGANIICYADDTLVIVQGKSFHEDEHHGTETVAQSRIGMLGLQVAINKSEVMYLSPRREQPRGSYFRDVDASESPCTA